MFKKINVWLIVLMLVFALPAVAGQGDLTVGIVHSTGEIDLDNAGITAGIDVDNGMWTAEIDLSTFDNVLELDRTGVKIGYEVIENLILSGTAGVQSANVTGLAEIFSPLSLGFETDTENGMFFGVGASYEYPFEAPGSWYDGIAPFISADYSQGQNDIEAVTLSALGISVTLPDVINEIGGITCWPISADISGEVNVQMFKGVIGLKKDFPIKSVVITPYAGVSYLVLNVETDISVPATVGWLDVTGTLNAENEANEAIGGVAGISVKASDFLESTAEVSFGNQNEVAFMGTLAFNF